MKIDATMWIASCTKIMTTIAAMQCVERGLLGLDDDVTIILPELKGRDILKGFEEGTQKPILVPSTKKMTLRLVLESLKDGWSAANQVTGTCSRINRD